MLAILPQASGGSLLNIRPFPPDRAGATESDTHFQIFPQIFSGNHIKAS